MSSFEQRKEFIQNNESSIYGGRNIDSEDVIVLLEQGQGMTLKTFQNNGWLRANYYDSEGYSEDELFEGRWDQF